MGVAYAAGMKYGMALWGLGLVLNFSSSAASKMELVQSVPLETTLAVPGLRDAQEVWLEMINGAKTTLDIEQFYISEQKGEALTPVLDAIKAAGKRGVKVRLLVDSKFFKTYPESVNEIGATPSCEARTVDFGDAVQHAKFFVVDGEVTFIGSQNFDWRALSHIHEIGIRIEDKGLTSQLLSVFERDWNKGDFTKPTVASKGTKDPLFVSAPQPLNPAGIAYSLPEILSLIKGAKRTVRVEVMEYSTDKGHWKELDNALRAAAKRGVRVQILVDESNLKKAKADMTALATVENVELKAVTIPQFSGGAIAYARLIHSKFLIADDAKVWIGTENWSESYFTKCRDVGVVTADGEIVKNLSLVFERVWKSDYAANL